jgi:hypothetical protein
MAFSHRDHRARRELQHLYLVFGAAIGALAVVACFFPDLTVRLLAVLGLGAAGTVYVVSADRLSDRYQRDLAAVRDGQPVSGAIRAEVYHEIGFERDREDDWIPSPHHRPIDVVAEVCLPVPPGAGPSPTSVARPDPPSDGS